MKKLLNLIALGLVSALLVGCMRDGKDGTNGVSVPGTPGQNGQNAPAAGAPAGGALVLGGGAGAGAVVNPSIRQLMVDLVQNGANQKILTITTLDLSPATAALSAIQQGLAAIGNTFQLEASPDGQNFTRVACAFNTGGGDNTLNATLAGRIPPAVGGLKGNSFIYAPKGGGAVLADSVFRTGTAGSLLFKFLTRDQDPYTGRVTGTCSVQASELDAFFGGAANQYGREVACTYAIIN